MDPIRVGQAIRLGLEPMRDHVTKIVNAYVKGNAVADIIEKRCGNRFDPPR